MPSASSRQSQQRARKTVCGKETPYGPCVVDIDLPLMDKPFTIGIIDPFAMLWRLFSECERFRTLIKDALRASPCSPSSPWHMIIYFDGVSPNNPLDKGSDLREMECVYWTLAEWDKLSDEDYWLTAAVVRGFLVNDKLAGGMSHFLKLLMHRFFGDGEDNFARTGILLEADDGQNVRIWFKHAVTVADYKAHASVLNGLGPNALKPCPTCRRVVSDAKTDVHIQGPGITPITSTDPSAWGRHTDQSMRVLAAKMQRSADADEDMKVAAKMHGMRHNPDSILADTRLQYNAASTCLYDLMHSWLIDGVMQRTFKVMMKRLQQQQSRVGCTLKPDFDTLTEYLQGWHWPRQVPHGRRVFEGGGLHGSASQTLSVAPVLHKYFSDIVRPVVLDAGASAGSIDVFLSACEVLVLLTRAMRGQTTPKLLRESTFAFMEQYQVEFGEDGWKVKFHLAMELTLQWEEMHVFLPKLPNCFALERKHKGGKKHMRDRFKGASQERGVAEELVLDQLHSMKQPGRLEFHAPSKTEQEQLCNELQLPIAAHILVAAEMKLQTGERYGARDVIYASSGLVGKITRLVEHDGHALARVEVWTEVRYDRSRHVGIYNMSGNVAFVPSSELRCAAIYRPHSDGARCTVLFSF